MLKSRARQAVKPMAHQLVSLKHDKTTPIVLDLSDAGTGKTAVRIWAAAERRRKGGGCILVLATRSSLRTVWANDIAKFAPDMKVSVATAANRDKAFAEKADFYVTNHDAVKWLAAQKPVFWDKFVDGEIVGDESSAFKHHTSQRSRAALKLFLPAKGKRRVFKRAALMTATPTSRSITDIWHQVLLLDGGQRLGNTFYGFRNSVCQPHQKSRFNANAIEWEDKPGAAEAVYGLINDIVVRHEFEKCVDIPKTFYHTVDYELSAKQRRVYEEMELAQVLRLSKGTMTAVNASAVTNKLIQIASGAVYDNDKVVQLIETERYESILDMVESRKHPLVFFFWKHQRDALTKEADSRGLQYAVIDADADDNDRTAIVTKYQQGLYDVVFAHPKSAAHALTMTAGTSIIWAAPTVDLEWWKQGNRRQARIGQKEKTEVIVCLAKNTVEERIYHGILMPKDKRMMTLMDLFAEQTAEMA